MRENVSGITMRWFTRGDVDGFFGLALDNLVQLLVIDSLCRGVLGFPAELVYGRILPGAAISVLVGNIFYAWQAMKLAREQGRSDVCALPYGINTVSLFGHVFFVMLPAKLWASDPRNGIADPVTFAWQAGLLACFGSGLIELLGAFVAERVRKATPRAALLSTLAGIALGFISFQFLFRTFARPLVGLTTLGIVMLTYFGRVRFRGRIPGGMIAVALGTALAWGSGLVPSGPRPPAPSLHVPLPVFADVFHTIGHLGDFASVIIAMGLFNVLGSLQNIESAEAAGDRFATRPSLAVNGIGSLAAAFLGSCFPTTIYIGHPGWKALGARAGYSILNGAFMTAICLTGTLAHISWAVPIEAGMAIVLWIGMVITAQAFQASPREHAPAVVVGLLPGVGAWGTLMAKQGLRAAGVGMGVPFSEKLIGEFQKTDTWIHGAFALEQGFLFTAMILSAATVAIIDRRFIIAGAWCLAASALSLIGLMHSYVFTPGDTALSLHPARPWAVGYAIMALIFFAAPLLTEEDSGHA